MSEQILMTPKRDENLEMVKNVQESKKTKKILYDVALLLLEIHLNSKADTS
jgi:hypothetical protein